MPEKNEVYANKVKYEGVFSFKDFYQFCYDYLSNEKGFGNLTEKSYKEKIKGNEKDVEVEWEDKKEFNDYFRHDIKVKFAVKRLKDVEVQQEGKKIKTQQGEIEVSMKGTVVSDYDGKFDTTPFNKVLRSIYEKWIIPSTYEQVKEKIIGPCDDFLAQAKAFLDLEGKSKPQENVFNIKSG